MHQRRMSLAGDAMSHAILPGAALAFLIFGLSTWQMSLFALIAGVAVSALAYGLTTHTQLKNDASFTLIYLLALASGVIMVSRAGAGLTFLHAIQQHTRHWG